MDDIVALPIPSLLVDRARLKGNIRRMQAVVNRHGVQIWPYVKTHKAVQIARMQLAAGATSLTCAMVGEAEAEHGRDRAEMELSVLSRQCLGERMESREWLTSAVAAWQERRNAARVRVDWQFTTADARVKLKRLYPKILTS